MDERLRQHEREAANGDPQAELRLRNTRERAGLCRTCGKPDEPRFLPIPVEMSSIDDEITGHILVKNPNVCWGHVIVIGSSCTSGTTQGIAIGRGATQVNPEDTPHR